MIHSAPHDQLAKNKGVGRAGLMPRSFCGLFSSGKFLLKLDTSHQVLPTFKGMKLYTEMNTRGQVPLEDFREVT